MEDAERRVAQTPAEIRRPKRVAGKTYQTETTPFTAQNRQFGEIRLRKDHGTELDLTLRARVAFIRACVRYARLKGRIDILQEQLSKLEEPIRQATDGHPGLRGIESERLGVAITDVSEVTITPNPILVRKASGSAFPQFGTEQVIATFMIPEDVQPSGQTITGERAEETIRLGFLIMGASEATLGTNLKTKRAMKVTDREALFNAVNEGLVPEEALATERSKRVEVKPLHPSMSRKPKNASQ